MLAMMVASLALAAWMVATATMEPGAAHDLVSDAARMFEERARAILIGGAAALGFEESARWVTRQPWRWQAARLLVKAVLVAAAALVALATFAWLVSAAVAALVGLVGQAWLLVEALAKAAGVPAPELAKVLVLSAALLLLSKWNPKKKRRARRRRY